jgi:hypothetical protein
MKYPISPLTHEVAQKIFQSLNLSHQKQFKKRKQDITT